MIKKSDNLKSSEITDEKFYYNRRKFIRTTSAALVTVAAGGALYDNLFSSPSVIGDDPVIKPKGPYDTNEKLTSYKDISTYNNFYEFGTDKSDPAENATNFKIELWHYHF